MSPAPTPFQAGRWSLADTQAQLPLPATAKWPLGVFDVETFARGGVSLLLFAPRGGDFQTAHDRDEFYIVVSGHAQLHVYDPVAGETAFPARSGDVLFVAAGCEHRFHDISEDFAAWVVFFPASTEDAS